MQRNRLILASDYEQLHIGMQRTVKLLDWQIINEPPELPEDLARLVTLESLGLRQPAPVQTESLGPLDADGLPTMLDDETVEAPPVTVVELLEGVPDDVPRQTAPMLTFGAAGGTVDQIAVIDVQPIIADTVTVPGVPSLEEYIRAGYDPVEYDRFVAEWQNEQRRAVLTYVAAVNADLPKATSDSETNGWDDENPQRLERDATELHDDKGSS